jgi:hypothetical protein
MIAHVSSGVAALLGAVLGASATLVVSILNSHFQAKREVTSWRREQKQAAYDSTTLALLRVRNRRRRMAASGWTTIDPGELPQYVNDVVDAQHGLWMLLAACGSDQREALHGVAEKFDDLVDDMLGKPPPKDLEGTLRRVDEVWDIVREAHRQDVGA